MTRPATLDEARARLSRLDGGLRLDEERTPPSWTAYVPGVGRGDGETWEAAWDAMVGESERRRAVVLGLDEAPALTITPDGHLTATDATVADVEQAIRQWRGERAAAHRAAEVARLEAPALAQWATLTPLSGGIRADAHGVAWKLTRSPTGIRRCEVDGWAQGARVVPTGGRVAHIVERRGSHQSCACGQTIHTGWSKPAPATMPLCRAHRPKP